MGHIIVTDETYEKDVANSRGLLLLDFFATWCGPCRMLSPILDEIGEEHPDVKICKVDVDNAPALAEKFSIESIPTVVFFKDGKPVKQFVGYRDKAFIVEQLKGM